MPREIVLFVPGVSGTYLRDIPTGKYTWGRPLYLLAWRNYYISRFPYRPDQTDRAAHGPVLDTIWFNRRLRIGVPFYEKAFRVLREQAGLRQGDVENPTPETTLYPWGYDWRRSLIDGAKYLDETVERLLDFHQDPDLRISLICHSNGGLLARHWWAYGARDVSETESPPPPDFPRRRNLGRLILVGTPNHGSLKLLFDATLGITPIRPFGLRYRPDFLFSLAPLYESLPFEWEDRFVDGSDEPVSLDLFDPDDWLRHRLGAFTEYPEMMDDEHARAFLAAALLRARRFQAALKHPWPDAMADTVHILASRCWRTIRRLRVTPRGVDLRLARRKTLPGRWTEERAARDPWNEAGDWFAPHESLVGLRHRPEHGHEVTCVHRHLFSDPRAQQALVETLTE